MVVEQGQGLEHFRILAVLEFTNERKRMSVICQEHKGRYFSPFYLLDDSPIIVKIDQPTWILLLQIVP